MNEVVYEAVACVTLDRDGERVSLKRGARLKLQPGAHDFDDRQLKRAVRDGKLRQLPLQVANG